MARYRVSIDERVRKKDMAGIPTAQLRRIIRRIGSLADDPRPHGSERLTGREEYRVRQGVYRILYEISDEAHEVVVRRVAHRRQAYRT